MRDEGRGKREEMVRMAVEKSGKGGFIENAAVKTLIMKSFSAR